MIINGTNANDQITGTSSADIINAKNGDDTVGAGAGNDLILGGNGNDNINAGSGNDIVDAGNGNDTVDGGTGNDIVFGGNGNDTLLGGAGNDLISGDNGDDILDGGAGTDFVSGGNGNDILVYRASENVGSVDIYDGGKGQDTLRLVVTQALANSATFRSDLATIQALIARYGSADYAFRSFDLAVVSIEKIEVVIEGSTNHAPVAVADIASVKEDVTTVASGNLLVNDTDADAGDTHIVSAVAGGTDNGTTITVVGSYGTLVVTKATGAYTYTLNNSSASVQALAAGQQATEQFTYTNADNHGGTGSSTLTVTVTGSNDPATITVSGSQDVSATEAGTVAGDPSASGQLAVHDVDNGEAHFAVPASLAGTYGNFTFNAATGAWTYTLDPVKSDPLTAGQQVTDTLTVTSADGSATHDIVVNITGTNDAAVIGNPDQHDVTEDGVLTASGTLSISDVDLNQAAFQAGEITAPGNLGTVTLLADGQYTYSVDNPAVQYLGANDVKTETFTVASVDGTTKNISFDIHGVNDGATISASSAEDTDVAEVGGIANVLAGDAHAGGQLTVHDVDSGEDHFLTPASLAGTYGDFLFNAMTGVWSYTLDPSKSDPLVAGQHVTDSLLVTSADGTATQTIVVNITGANDTAIITSSSSEDTAVTEAGGVANALTGDSHAGGQLTVQDVDSGQAHFVNPSSLAGAFGDFTFDAASGNWSYTLDQGKSQSLSGGQSATDKLTVASVDGTTHDIVVDIAGANDAPGGAVFIQADVALPEGSAIGEVVGTVTGSDPDSTDVLTYSLVDDNGAPYAGPLAIDAHTGLVTVNGDIDFESTDGLITAVVRTTDQGNLHSDKVISVVIGDQPETTISAIEGYIANATVFVDDDGDGVLSSGDFVTHSDTLGNFHVTGTHTGAIYLLGGGSAVDTATGLPFNGILRAAPGSTVLSPLTTLIAAIADQNNGDFAAAKAQVAAAFNVPVGVDLNSFDPIAAAVSDDPAAQAAGAQLFAAGVQLYNVIVQGASLISGAAGSSDTQAAANAMLDAIVTQVSNGTLDLSDPNTLQSVITAAAGTTDVASTVAGAANVIASSNTLIDSAVASTSGTDLLQSIAGTASVAQGVAAQALADAGQSGDTTAAVDTFTGPNLQTAVDTATADIDTNALLGPAGDNTLTGTSGADLLDGAGGSDHLYGLGGKDILIGGSGDDYLDGGQGFDRAIYSDATGGITANLVAGTVSGQGVGADILTGVESVVGSDFADVFDARGFTGDAQIPGTPVGYNEFEGRGGDDTIYSNTNSQGAELTRVSYVSATGAVTVDLAAGYAQGDASVGHDTLVGSGFNGAWGSAYNDTILGSNNPMFTAEVYAGFAGNDYIDGRGGFDRVDYNVDPNTATGITVNLAAGTVAGDSTIGTDTLRGIEAIRGTNFADSYTAVGFGSGSVNAGSSGTFNEFTGNGGDDTITGNGFTRLGFNNATAGVQVDFVSGIATGDSSVGTDHFTGVNAVQASMFGDTLLGGATNDTFTGLAGDDYIDGRGGFDVASYNNIFFTTGGITVNMAGGTVDGDASTGHDTLRSIEGVQGTNFADTYNATMYGLTGPNFGNNGTFNQFEGLGGDDVIIGNGNTRLIYGNSTAGVTINLSTGSATGDGSVGHDTFNGVNSALGSNFNDFYNAAGFNSLNGTFNAFQGQGGDDVITGNGNTQIQFNNATGGVTVNLAAGTANGDTSVGHDTFSGVNAASGSNFADLYDATGFNGLNGTFNAFQGNAGNDTVTGNGNTQIQFGSATNGVTVNLTAGTADGDGSVGHDTITGGVFNAAGSGFNDTLVGSASNDSLFGNGGNDVLDGRGGNDFLSGGAGTDTFVYATGGGFDFVQDFVQGQDKIDLTGVYGIFSLQDLQSHLTQQGFDTVINLGAGDSLTLQNVNAGSLAASDFIFGTAGAPIVGDDNPNTLVGTASSESMSGLGGNDRLQGLGGSDLLDGGAGFDRAVYTDATGGIAVSLTAGTVSGPGVGTDTLVSIEGIVGSNFADLYDATGFTGASGIPGAAVGLNEFEGGAGNDVIVGSVNASGQILTRISYASATSAVTVDLAAGTADGNASVGHDSFTNVNAIVASAHDDTLLGTNNASGTYEQFDARGGNDLIDGRGGYDFASYNQDAATTSGVTVNLAVGTVTGDGSVGTDTLRSIEGVRGTNFIDSYDATGFGGSSTNAGSFGAFNNFEGMGGNDSITGNGTTRLQFTQALDGVTVDIAGGTSHGTAGGDVAQVGTDTFTGVNAVLGSLFDDVLLGSNNSTIGENFQGLAGNDFIDGRGGFDTAQYSNLTYITGGVSVNMANGIVTGDASTGTDTLHSVEGIQGTIFADSYVATGFSGSSTNAGSFGTFNQFEGLGGDDSITGNGNTRLLYTSATAGVTIKLSAGSATGDASVGHDTFTGVNAAYGSNFVDTYDATGFVGFNAFQGLGGDDIITGNGSTRLQFDNATSGVNVDLAAGTVSGDASVGHDIVLGGVNSVIGTNFNDTIRGGKLADTLTGNGGADTFGYATGGGADVVTDFAQAQGDKIDLTGIAGANGVYSLADVAAHTQQVVNDTVITFGNGDSLTLKNVTFSNLTAADFIFGTQGTTITGTDNPETLPGTANSDTIFGVGGNDRLQGVGGSDLLDGGLGVDRAVYTDATAGVTVNLGSGTAVGPGVGTDTLVNIEAAAGSDYADIYNAAGFMGDSGIPGVSPGFNEFEGRGGDDIIIGNVNPSGQILTRASYVSATAAVTADLAAGTATGDASVGHDTFMNVNALTGSAFGDTLLGGNNGSGTYEQFDGRGGNDFIDGRGGYDFVNYNSDPATSSGIAVNLAAGTISGDSSIGTDTLRSVEAVRGTAFNDNYDATGFSGTSINAGSFSTFNNFEGMGGDDVITGNGNTRLQFTQALDGVTVDIAAGTSHGSAGGDVAQVGADVFTGVNAAMGSLFADTLLGSNGNETFLGLAGNDFIDGRGGFDTAQYSNLTFTTGGVIVDMASGVVTGDASTGTDTLMSIEGIQGTIFADSYTAIGFSGSSANAGNNGTFNQFEGMGGDDVITGNGNTRLIYGGATGSVTINLAAGTASGDASIGHDSFTGVNSAIGGSFADVYNAIGFAGFNAFQGQGGDDTILGNGNTQIFFNNATAAVVVDLAAGTASGDGSVGHDTLTGVNNVVGSNFNDTIFGSHFTSDNLNGNAGNDYLNGGAGNDFLTGGAGSDLFVYSGLGDADVVNDFSHAQGDMIEIAGVAGIASFADVLSHAAQLGGNTVITFDAVNSLTLNNVTLASLTAADFAITSGNNGVVINGDNGDNFTLAGGSGQDTILGNDGNDQLFGNEGDDVLLGGNGSDVLMGGAGNDLLNGGSNANGNPDQAVYYNSPGAVSVNLATGVASDGYGGTDTLIGIEYVNGSIFNDTLIGSTATNEMFEGNGGNDVIDGGGHSSPGYGDWVNYVNFSTGGVVVNLSSLTIAGVGPNSATDGLGGLDTLINIDSVIGSHQNDIIVGNSNDNILRGFEGSDLIRAGAGNDVVYGGEQNRPEIGGNDFLYGDAGNDQIIGGSGNDLIAGGAGFDSLTGGAGADTFVYGTNDGGDLILDFSQLEGDKIDLTGIAGAAGVFSLADVQALAQQIGPHTVITFSATDSLTLANVNLASLTAGDFIFGTQGVTVNGDAGNNNLTGTANADTINGLDGADRLQGFAGSDLLDGGLGFDRAVYSDATGGISAVLAAGSVVGAGVGTDALINVEGIVGSDFADTYDATGFAGDTGIPGTQVGFNEFEGRGGDDIIISASNASGAPLTRISYVSATAGVTVDLAAKTATGNASIGSDTIVGSGVSNVVGSSFADLLEGSSNLFGTVEIFDGRGGNDIIDGRGGFDRADYANDPSITSAGISVALTAGTVTVNTSAGTDTDTLISVESVRGSNFADTFTATGFSGAGPNPGSNGTFNEFNGMGGDDHIFGNGNTRLAFVNATGAVVVDLQTGGTPGTGVADGDSSTGHDTFSGVNAVQASMFNDTLSGSSNSDTFAGNAGNDSIDGRGGFDTASYNNIYFVTGGVTVDLAAGTATGDASIGTDTLRSIEGIQGTVFADTFVATGYGSGNVGVLNIGNNGTFNQFEGLGGDDVITGNGATRLLYGNSTAGVTIDLAAGSATGDLSVGHDTFSGVNSANGSNFVDTYDATGFAGPFGPFNSFQGLAGDDIIIGNGFTQIQYGNATAGVTIDMVAGTAVGNSSVGTDHFTGVNNVIGSNSSDTITGSAANETLNGAAGADTINGGDGYDTLIGGATGDIIDGGAGGDVAVFSGASTEYMIAQMPGGQIQVLDLVGNRDGTDMLSNVELLQFTDQIVMTTSGTAVAPVDISGLFLNGNATIMGTAGDDYLQVGGNLFGHLIDLGAGANTVSVGNGGGFYGFSLLNVANVVGGDGNDTVNINNVVNGLSVDLGAGGNFLHLASGANTLSVSNVSFINGSDFGGFNPFNDVLTLSNDQNGTSINLGDGNNTLNLEGTDNTLSDLWNIQTINGSAGDDTLALNGMTTNSAIDLGAGTDSLTLNGMFNNVVVSNIENVVGSSMSDTIVVGNASGPTTVTGGGGMDMMTASAGADNFRYASVSDSYIGMSDTIDGFDASQDHFVFATSMVGGGGFTTSSVNFVDSDPFTATGQSQARLDTSGGETMLQIDVNGDGTMDGSDMQVHLTNNVGALTNGNFLFV